MKYVIHIGQSKTGTSSLQSFLARNRTALARRGILFPDVLVNGTPLNVVEHNAVAEALAGYYMYPDLSPEEYFRQFEEQAKTQNCDTMIVSAESFFGAPQIWRVPDEEHFWKAQTKKIKNLSAFIKQHDIHIVVYLRHQSDWFESAVSQIIRTAGLLGHHVYDNDEQLFSFLKPHMDYGRILSLWSDEFPNAHLSVIPFDGNTVDNFCARLGIETAGLLVPETKENITWDKRYIWLKNKLNQNKKGKTKERVIMHLLSELNKSLPSVQKYQITPELRKEIFSFYAPLNEELSQRHHIKTPNALTDHQPARTYSAITDKEKQEALTAYKRAFYAPKTLILFARYATGAFLRAYLPFVNALLKRFIK